MWFTATEILKNNVEKLKDMSNIGARSKAPILCTCSGKYHKLNNPLPLHLCIFLGRNECAKVFIDNNADVNAIDKNSGVLF